MLANCQVARESWVRLLEVRVCYGPLSNGMLPASALLHPIEDSSKPYRP